RRNRGGCDARTRRTPYLDKRLLSDQSGRSASCRWPPSFRVLIVVVGGKASMFSVIAPALLVSIGHHHRLSVDQSSRQADGAGVGSGDLPHGGFLGYVPTHFDDVTGFQTVLWKTHSI